MEELTHVAIAYGICLHCKKSGRRRKQFKSIIPEGQTRLQVERELIAVAKKWEKLHSSPLYHKHCERFRVQTQSNPEEPQSPSDGGVGSPAPDVLRHREGQD